MTNLTPSQRVAIIGVVNPQSATAVQSSDWIDVTKFGKFMAVVLAGALGASATVDAKIQQATSAGGAGAKDVSGKAITQFTKAGSDDNKQAVIEFDSDDLDFTAGFKFVRLAITPATAACLISGAVLGFDPRYGNASDNDASTVDEIVGL